ncbi:MAG TPA: hypothetical protein VN874_10535 [Myxococcales bacterium]|nr:hypothetical protein [Myxococcales bacterium]
MSRKFRGNPAVQPSGSVAVPSVVALMFKQTASTRKPKVRPMAFVVDLSAARHSRRRQTAERRVRAVLEDNRAALSRLFASGLIFTQKGSRAARELLGAHQGLLKVIDFLTRLGAEERSLDLRLKLRGEEIFEHLDAQLARTAQLTARTGEFLSGRGRE